MKLVRFCLIIVFIILNLSFGLSLGYSPRVTKSKKDVLSEAESVYELVYDHYSDILEDYYNLDKVLFTERDYYTKKLLNTITKHVVDGKLPLYGNCFSRFWRNITKVDQNRAPLKKFDNTSLEDALGHISKYNQILLNKGYRNQKLEDLSFSLNNIRNIVRSSLEYKYEELTLRLVELESDLAITKINCENLMQELKLEKEKSSKNVIYKVTTVESLI